MSEATVRQRNLKTEVKAAPAKALRDDVPNEVEDTDRVISILDIFRIIFTIFAASCAFSYYTTSGESVFWGYRPWFTRPELVKAYFVSLRQDCLPR